VSPSNRAELAEDLLRRVAAALRAAQLYSPGHPLITQSLDGLRSVLETLHQGSPTVVIGIVADELVVDDLPIPNSETLRPLITRLTSIGIERVAIDRGVTAGELAALTRFIASAVPGATDRAMPSSPHLRVGRVTVEETDPESTDMAALRRLYGDSSQAAREIWDSALTEGQPDASVTRTVVENLAQAVSQHRTTLLALTALRDYDNYTFTHMVNVSILTMAQARALGLEGGLLREIGVAALMHDIGKVRTPLEILNKADQLTPAEFAVMKRHTVDGAVILRSTAGMPTLAPIVAFEHHLRIDGSGYPESSRRHALNLGTMLCSIADVYDAMRSQRAYQTSHPSDRVLAVLQRNDGRQFDPDLVRRFTQLIGIYPVGNLVKLNTGETAVVRAIHAPDPRRPHVRVIVDRHGVRLGVPIDLNLWEMVSEGALAPAIVAPVDPRTIGIDPLTLL
jgi:putative nucleotidyltransferase with HDIG domain